jgi:hypothetical protein
MQAVCPVAGKPGRRVPPVTVRSLVRDERASETEGRDWFFCDLPDCPVVYFAQDGKTISKDALKVRVGVKEKDGQRPVCYCFGHTVESIRDEIAKTGMSTVLASITAKVKAGECSCETMNPKGTCCLGDVSRAVKEASASSASVPLQSTSVEPRSSPMGQRPSPYLRAAVKQDLDARLREIERDRLVLQDLLSSRNSVRQGCSRDGLFKVMAECVSAATVCPILDACDFEKEEP